MVPIYYYAVLCTTNFHIDISDITIENQKYRILKKKEDLNCFGYGVESRGSKLPTVHLEIY